MVFVKHVRFGERMNECELSWLAQRAAQSDSFPKPARLLRDSFQASELDEPNPEYQTWRANKSEVDIRIHQQKKKVCPSVSVQDFLVTDGKLTCDCA